MSKIDHNSPSLRYLDNLRRELSRSSLAVGTGLAFAHASVVPHPTKRSQVREAASPAAYERHMKRFDILRQEQQEVLGNMINSYVALMDARLVEIEALMPGNRRKGRTAARKNAEQAVSRACTAYHRQCRADEVGGKSATREWFRKLLTLLGPERVHWEELEIIIKGTR